MKNVDQIFGTMSYMLGRPPFSSVATSNCERQNVIATLEVTLAAILLPGNSCNCSKSLTVVSLED